MLRIFALCFLFCMVTQAHAKTDDSEELDDLLDSDVEETEVEPEQEYALPVPKSSEEDSPVLSETDQGPVNPGARNNEELFLPVPSDQAGAPGVEGESSDDFLPFYKSGDVRHETADTGFRKPGWSLFGGYSSKSYQSVVLTASNGLEVGTNFRILGGSLFKMPISIHAFGAVSFINLNDVVGLGQTSADVVQEMTVRSVKDRTFRVGGILEWEISRRFQLYGGLVKYFNTIEDKGAIISASGGVTSPGPLVDRLKEDRISPGVGAQWEFYVIPHASFGLRAWAEIRYFALLLTFSAEPVPKHRNSLNFEWDD